MLTLTSEEKGVFGRNSHSSFFQQEHLLELFFAMFYASVNVGAVLCMWFIPMVRSEYVQSVLFQSYNTCKNSPWLLSSS